MLSIQGVVWKIIPPNDCLLGRKGNREPMLVAHLVPGYFVTVQSRSYWQPEWSTAQNALLWMVGLGSTVIPDFDVVYNVLFRGFFNHSVLWTHSLFVPAIVLLIWWVLQRTRCWPYLQKLTWLMAMGFLSHLLLDVIAHGTPLLYPVSMVIFGAPPTRVVEGGIWAYLTDPIFLLEPFLLTLMAIHWIMYYPNQRTRTVGLVMLITGLGTFTLSFLLLLPKLQKLVAALI